MQEYVEREKAILDEAIKATEALRRAENQLDVVLYAVKAVVETAGGTGDVEALKLARDVAEGARATRRGMRQMLRGLGELGKLVVEGRRVPVYISLPVEGGKKP